MFCRSSDKTAALAELVSVNDVEVLSFRPLQEVQWLSRHFAVGTLVKNLDALALHS